MQPQATINATEAKNRFGEVLEKARREPVLILKTGREVAVVLDAQEYRRLRRLEDRYWGELADKAKQSGFVGAEEALHKITDAAGAGEGADDEEA